MIKTTFSRTKEVAVSKSVGCKGIDRVPNPQCKVQKATGSRKYKRDANFDAIKIYNDSRRHAVGLTRSQTVVIAKQSKKYTLNENDKIMYHGYNFPGGKELVPVDKRLDTMARYHG